MEAAKNLGLAQSVISDWNTKGRIPYVRQLWLEERAKQDGKRLRADKDAWRGDVRKGR